MVWNNLLADLYDAPVDITVSMLINYHRGIKTSLNRLPNIEAIPEDLKNLIKDMTNMSPRNRPNIDNVIIKLINIGVN